MGEKKTGNLDGIIVIDTGEDYYIQTNRIIHSNRKHPTIPYGSFLLCFSNIDIEKLNKHITIFSKQFKDKVYTLYKQNNIKKSPIPIKSELKVQKALLSIIDMFKSKFYNIVLKYIPGYYLSQNDKDYITSLIVNECVNLIMNDLTDTSNDNYIPKILRHPNLNGLVESILFQKSSSINDEINELLFDAKLESSIQLIEKDTLFTIYYIRNLTELFALDIMNFIKTKKKASKCQQCGSNFFIKNRSDEIYCSYPKENGKTCKEMALQHRLKENPYEDAKYKARKKVQTFLSRNYDEDTAKEIYKKWSKELTNKAKEYLKKNDFTGFIDWINENNPMKKKVSL